MNTPSLGHLTSEDYNCVYEPAEDSFLFLDSLEDELTLIRQRKPALCVEIGCGSGVISTAVAKALGSQIFCLAVDINPAACDATVRTAKANAVSVDVLMGNLVESIQSSGTVDLLLFNPPYVPTPTEEINHADFLTKSWAGGFQGREVMDKLFPCLKHLLSPQGLFYLVVSAENCIPEVEEILARDGFKCHMVRKRQIRGEHLEVLRFGRDLQIKKV